MLIIKITVSTWNDILYYLDEVAEEYAMYNIKYTSDIHYNNLKNKYIVIIKICN